MVAEIKIKEFVINQFIVAPLNGSLQLRFLPSKPFCATRLIPRKRYYFNVLQKSQGTYSGPLIFSCDNVLVNCASDANHLLGDGVFGRNFNLIVQSVKFPPS